MATACLMIGWNRPYPGHEKEAYGTLTGEGLELIGKWKKAGFFEDHELVALTAHGGDLNGFILLKGERAKLDELRRTDEFEHFVIHLGLHMDRMGTIPGVTEAGIRKVMERNPDFKR
jgi:hypothetical protein